MAGPAKEVAGVSGVKSLHLSAVRSVPSKIHETMPVQIGLNGPKDVDSEVLGWLRKAYEENR
jgi:hypothetical protein